MDCSPPASLLCPWGFSRREYWSGLPCPFLGDLPNPGIKPRSPALQVDSLQSEPPGKPKNTGVGSLSLPQGNFLTQELNWGLLHYKQILYKLSHQRSPIYTYIYIYIYTHIHICICIYIYSFSCPFPLRFVIQSAEYNSLCYTVGPCSSSFYM